MSRRRYDATRQDDEWTADERLRFACPSCSEPIDADSLACSNCATDGTVRRGIPSWTSDRNGDVSRWLEERELDALATRVERESIRDATTAVLEDHEHRSAVLDELYNVQRDAWRVLLPDLLAGRCLDLGAGFGRRSALLAERADRVVAVDSSLPKLRIAASRDDYDSTDRVVPVHTTADRLPFPTGAFDTIVADLTSATATADDRSDRARLERLRRHLDDDGTLVCIADGWPRESGLTDLVGLESTGSVTPTGRGDLVPGTAKGYRSLAREVGFDHVSVYALFPTATKPLFVFDVESDQAIRRVADFLARDAGRLARPGRRSLTLAHRLGVLERVYPSYLVVCTNDREPSNDRFTEPLVKAGRARSVVLDGGGGEGRNENGGEAGLETVWKIPNRTAHEPLTDRENAILESLETEVEPIADALPEGRRAESEFGAVRAERPVGGRKLADLLSDDPESFDRVLRIGFEWLATFQRAARGPTVERSPADVRADLRFEPAGLEPPAVTEPVETFFTPVHGDFMAQNVYVDDGEVTTVIDWEYGAIEANPMIDAGFFLLDTATQLVGRPEDAIDTVLCGDGEYAARARERVAAYCDAVGLPRRTFERYLPAVYLHRLELDWRFDAVSTYSTKMRDRSALVEYVYDRHDRLRLS